MRSREIKKHVLSLLKKGQWPEISDTLLQYRENDVLSPLFSALYSADEVSKWHSVRSFGLVVCRIAQQDLESARVVMRRFLWSLNDESGGIGWGAPEAMAEIMACNDRLFAEYNHMLISYMRHDGPELFQDGNYLELPALQQGLLWGIGRLLLSRQQVMLDRGVAYDLKPYLCSPDKIVQGMACWCLGMCKQEEMIEYLHHKTEVDTTFNLYLNGCLKEVSVAELARCSINRLQGDESPVCRYYTLDYQ